MARTKKKPLRRCELYEESSKELISPVSKTVVGQCYSVSELMNRTMAGMPVSASIRQLQVYDGDTSDLFDDDEDDALVHLSNLKKLADSVEEFENSAPHDDPSTPPETETVEKAVDKPVDKPVDKQ